MPVTHLVLEGQKSNSFFIQNVVSAKQVTGLEKETGLKEVREWKQPKIEWPVIHRLSLMHTQVLHARLEIGSEGVRV